MARQWQQVNANGERPRSYSLTFAWLSWLHILTKSIAWRRGTDFAADFIGWFFGMPSVYDG